MSERKKQLRGNIAAFLLLFLVSLYRQISLQYWPRDPFRTYILYACYVFLLAAWGVSLCMRVTQRNMRRFLLLEDLVMFAGLTLRFVQDTFLSENIRLMRVTGLFVSATCLPLVLLGLYGSLCIGRSDSFRIPRKWYFLLVPVLILLLLNLTDEYHHFVTYIVPEEPQPNLIFHPYIGTYLIYALGIAIMIARVLLIYKRNNIMADRPFLRRSVPFLESLLLILFSIPYILNYLRINPPIAPPEIIEFYAKIYYTEALTWEMYIYLGLVPVNTSYQDIFEHATIGMQIIGADGSRILSKNAADIPDALLDTLKDRSWAAVEPGRELHLYRLPEGYFIWSKDISYLQETIDELNRSAETLAQESVLLDQELKTKNEETGLLIQNQIYDELTGEIQGQLRLMKEVLKKRTVVADTDALLRQLCLMGTYVKRRCNLCLIEKVANGIDGEDLRLSFEDMISALRLMDIPAEMRWAPTVTFSAKFIIFLFDSLEQLLERERFSLRGLTIAAEEDRVIFSIQGSDLGIPASEAERQYAPAYRIDWQALPHGYRVILTEGGA